MRDALSLTDQAIAYAAGQVTLDAVQGMLGALDQSYLVRLLDALVAQDGADLMAVADEMASRSLSYNGALQDLATLLHRIALAQSVPAALPEDLPELPDIQRLATQFDPQEVQLYYQIAVHGRNEMGLAPDEYAGFTMTLLRMLAFRPGQGGGEATAQSQPPAARMAPPARAAASAVASHATMPTRAPAAPAAAAPAASAPPASAPAASAPPPAAAQPDARGAAPMNTARAALNAALEAARAAARNVGGGKRPSAPSPSSAAESAAPAAPAPQPPAASSQPAASAPPAPPAPQMRAAPQQSSAPSTPSAPQMRAAPQAPAAPPPWEQGQPGAAMRAQPQAQAQAAQYDDGDTLTDEPPPWVTEFSDDSAVSAEAPQLAAPPAPVRAPAKAPHAQVITPVPAIGWDGNWPALAASLPLRGVAQQLALQTELVGCVADGGSATFRLRVPVDTLRASGNSEKLCAALQECFPQVRVNIDTEIGPVWYTAGAEAKAERERRQHEAEAFVEAHPFVQSMAQHFDAFVVPGSVRPKAA
jgi:DNA polymerase-3 subunit gamma/tau